MGEVLVKYQRTLHQPRSFILPKSKECAGPCGRELPLNAENWHTRREVPTWKPRHWHDVCRECRQVADRAKYAANPNAAKEARDRRHAREKAQRDKYANSYRVNLMSPKALRAWEEKRAAENQAKVDHALWLANEIAVLNETMPRTRLSFSEAAAKQKAEWTDLARCMEQSTPREGDERWLAEQCDAVWSDNSLSIGQRQAKVSALRRQYQD